MAALPPYPSDLLLALRRGSSFVVIGHVSPDGDCLASEMAMGNLLTSLGKEVLLANAGPFERDEIKAWKQFFVPSIPPSYLEKRPTVVIVDCSARDRIGTLADQIEGLSVIVIDHHASGEKWGDYQYIVGDSPSTTLLVQHLFHATGVEITPQVADLLFYGFSTDTGFFKFLNAGQGEALRMCAELVDRGASPNMTEARMTGGKRLSFIKYLGVLIDRTQSLFGGKVLCSSAYLSDGEKYGDDKPGDLYYGQMLSVAGCEVVLLFKEREGGKTEVGFRSSHLSNVDVGALAALHGGGGHRHASGMTGEGTIEETKARVLRSLADFLK